AAHRLAEHIGALEIERLHHVEAVEDQVELVLEVLEAGRPAEAGEERRPDVVLARQQRQRAVPGGDAARAVQEEERGAVAGVAYLDRRPPGAERDDARARRAHAAAGRSAARRAASACAPGTARCSGGSDLGDQWSSYSLQIGRRCGMTSVAKR